MQRRTFLKQAMAGAAGAFAGGAAPGAFGAPGRKPNVIVIFTDDQGSLDMNLYGARDLLTPHMDSIGRQGVRFTQFYAGAPICSASRSCLMTGKYNLRAGVESNVSSQPGAPGMPGSEFTMAEMLKEAGYATAHIGKWHLGFSPETMPNAQGFDYSFGHMGGCIDNYSHFFYWNGPNRHDLYRNGEEIFEDGSYFPDLMADEAAGFMEAHRDEPFFIYFAMNTPHYPYQGEAHWLEQYEEQGVESPRDMYAAFMTSLDARIGRLLDSVDALGLREDTIVIFQSDHGHSTEERAFHGGGYAGPYRGAKSSFFEGGIRVPAAIRWPGRIPAGQVRDQMAHGCDWLPTVAALCGAEVPAGIDGESLEPVIADADATTPHEVLHWQTGRGPNASWAVREGDWKLLGNPRDTSNTAPVPPDNAPFLVNLAEDPGEQTNLAESEPDMLSRLSRLHNSWIAEVEAEGG